jgi:hypothetical protein
VVNAATPDEAIEIAKKFSLQDVAKNITRPFLVTHGSARRGRRRSTIDALIAARGRETGGMDIKPIERSIQPL